jgi:tetratricopeptide (TPR) repeat protein
MITAMILFATLWAVPSALPVEAPPPQRPNANQKVIKDPAEYNAYHNAINIPGPAQRAAALEAFVRDYPESMVKVEALEQAMAAYQQAGNTQKVEATARRILEIEPFNARALAILTFISRNKVVSGDPSALQETCNDARKGLNELSRMSDRPTLMNEGDSRKLRVQMADIFFGAAGFCALQGKDYSTARDNYTKALQINPNNMEDTYQMGIANLEMTPLDVTGFWYLARAINLADNQGNASAKSGITGYATAKYRSYHGNDGGWDQIVAQAADQTAVPPGFTVSRQPTPAELAVQAVQQNDPANLSFSDWEFVLKYRDASPANKDAADKIWEHIQTVEKNGQASLKLPIKVISADKQTMQAAISDDNRQSNTADLQVTMQKPLSRPPAPGASIDIIGVITTYTPQPFTFTMIKGQISGQPVAHTQLSENDVEDLLKGGVSVKRTTELVKQKGVNFSLDTASEARLKKAGANDELLLAIATSKK